MNLHKTFVVLLALLLAGMAIAPVASAEQDQVSAINTDFQIPQLDTKSSLAIKNVDLPLSPMDDKSVYSIPEGSIIHHTSDGLTKVYDKDGKGIFSANDQDSQMIPTSAGITKPATYIHLVPTDSHAYHKGKQTFVTDDKGNLILTIINDNPLASGTANSKSAVLFNEWIEWAEDTTVSSLTQFDAYWYVPSNPPSSESLEAIYLFNGISPSGGGPGIVQPVLEWNRPDTGLYWTATAWGCSPNPGEDDIGNRITVSTGDRLKGRLYWSTTYNQWYVQLSDLTQGTYSTVYSDILPGHTNLEAYVALEGYNFDDDTDVPGDTEFYDMVFRDSGTTVPMAFHDHYGSLALQRLSGLDVNILSGTDIWLNTAN